eukprot:498746_1
MTTKIDIPIKGKMSKKVKTIAVIGGGTMGYNIAAMLISKPDGYKVIIKEISKDLLNKTKANVEKLIMRMEKKGVLGNKKTHDVLKLIKYQIDYKGFKNVDLCIEAVSERLELKQKIFAELAGVCKKQCILATNTSTINIDDITSKLSSDVLFRVIGLHFFAPAHVMKLLEIIRTKSTDNIIVSDMINFAKNINKIPVVIGNCVGFAANRMFAPYTQAAQFLIEHGVNPYRIDKVLQTFGMKIGVCKMMDLSGIDIFCDIDNKMKYAYTYSYDGAVLKQLRKADRFGQKNKLGFYKYHDGNNKWKPYPDGKALKKLIINIQNEKKIEFKLKEISDEDIIEICLYPVVNESFRILSEGFVCKGSDLDIVSIFGYGFPKQKGGIYYWAVYQIGLEKIAKKLMNWSILFGAKVSDQYKNNVVQFLKPCAKLNQSTKN